MPGDPDRLPAGIVGLPGTERTKLLAQCIALTLNDVRAVERPRTLDPLRALLGLGMADWLVAERTTYFKRVTNEVIGHAISEGAGPEVASRYKGVSKRELARVADRDLASRRWSSAPLRASSSEVVAAEN